MLPLISAVFALQYPGANTSQGKIQRRWSEDGRGMQG